MAINLHVAVAADEPIVRDYTASFAAAARSGALPGPLASTPASSAGMRNVLIHGYVAVDLERVAAAVPLARRGYGEYVGALARYVRTHEV